MKVLVVATQTDHEGGGAATAARQLALGLQRLGVDVVLVGTHRQGGLTITERDGIRHYSFRPHNLYWIGDKDTKPAYMRAVFQAVDLWNPHVYRVLRAIIAREQPDVVHTQKLRGLSPSVWAAADAAGVAGLRLAHTCHDHELISPEGTLAGRLGELALRGSRWLWPYQALRRAQSRRVDIVTAPSRMTLERHTTLAFFPQAQAQVVPNSHGFSQAELDELCLQVRDRKHSDPATTRLVYLGRLDSIKGIEVLCTAFERAVALRPGLRLDVAGTGVLLESLRAQYRQLPEIVFHGQVEGARKSDLLATADALVVPTVAQEAFGIVIVEAFAHGTPVLASAIGGIPELVREGETGFLVEPGNVARLTEKLVWASDHAATLHNLRPLCLAAARVYTLEMVAAAHRTAYEAASAQRPAGPPTMHVIR